MLNSAPGEGGQREPQRDGGTSPEPGDSGLTDFLADDPTNTGLSREALIESVRLLIRERDYLRKIRDVQMAEYRGQSEHLILERDALLKDRETWRDRANRAEARLARTLSGRVKRSLLWLLGRGQ